MIPGDREVITRAGERYTAEEIFEAFVLLAKNDATFPLLGESDKIKAVMSTAVEALDWAREEDVL